MTPKVEQLLRICTEMSLRLQANKGRSPLDAVTQRYWAGLLREATLSVWTEQAEAEPPSSPQPETSPAVVEEGPLYHWPTVQVCYGVDGVCVVHLFTQDLPEDDKGPRLRLYINDEVVYENPPYSGTV